jgi:hypothetical protein
VESAVCASHPFNLLSPGSLPLIFTFHSVPLATFQFPDSPHTASAPSPSAYNIPVLEQSPLVPVQDWLLVPASAFFLSQSGIVLTECQETVQH